MGRGFIFDTQHGHRYYYSDIDGSVQLVDDAIESKFADAVEGEYKPSEREAIETLVKNTFRREKSRHLSLVVTEKCNLRCKYCQYSGHYPDERTHKNKNMSWEISQKAIDTYFKTLIETQKVNPTIRPTIGFYGGEPFMNLDLMKRCINYIQEKYGNSVYYSLTTNSTLITNDIMDFFVNNNFNVGFSLNGDKTEHDRLRVFPGDLGSFEVVIEGLHRLQRKYPDFYRRKCRLIVVYDVGTNLLNLKRFFEQNNEGLPDIVRLGSVNGFSTDWYSQYTPDIFHRHKSMLDELRFEYVDILQKGKKPTLFLQKLIGDEYSKIFGRSQNVWRDVNVSLPFTAACVPGSFKVNTDTDGNFHCCEKINQHFPIGDIEAGVDINRVIEMICQYQANIFPACARCSITRLCPLCQVNFAGKGIFKREPEDLCGRVLQTMKIKFGEVWSMLEKGIKESQILLSTMPTPEDR